MLIGVCISVFVFAVIPAKAGIHFCLDRERHWMTSHSAVENPAFAGMTSKWKCSLC